MEKIRITNEPLANLKQVIVYCMELTGFNTLNISTDSMQIICTYLLENYKTITLSEIKEAFVRGVNGELDVNLTHYQNFNALYVSNVLQAFKRYQQKNYKPPKRTELDYTPTKEDDETHFNFIANVFKETKQAPLIANWNAAYLHAEKVGLIKLTNDEKAMFMENVIEELKEEKQRLKVQRLNWSSIEETLTTPALLKYECRKRILIKYFENNHENNI
jgi:hypothetical protein